MILFISEGIGYFRFHGLFQISDFMGLVEGIRERMLN